MSLKPRHITVSTEVLAQNVGDEAVLLDMRTESYFSLNAVGVRVWQLLQETGDLKTIRERMLQEYEVAEADLDRDLDALIERLLAAGLVLEKEGAAA